jgi:hypothetical protein
VLPDRRFKGGALRNGAFSALGNATTRRGRRMTLRQRGRRVPWGIPAAPAGSGVSMSRYVKANIFVDGQVIPA